MPKCPPPSIAVLAAALAFLFAFMAHGLLHLSTACVLIGLAFTASALASVCTLIKPMAQRWTEARKGQHADHWQHRQSR